MDRLLGTIQPYAWGDPSFLANLQGRDASGDPEAELWYGAHPVAPSRLAAGGTSLLDAVTADPEGILGPDIAHRFGGFPFLLKILAAAEPLSIQAHPSKDRAAAGFAREEAAGVPRTDPARTYRDDNHKPELLVALTPFEAKCGFRPVAATAELLALLAGAVDPGAEGGALVAELARRLGRGSDPDGDRAVLAEVLAWLFSLERGPAQALVAATVAAAQRLAGDDDHPAGEFGPELAWTPELHRVHPGDIGVVVALLLNHVTLEPGQGVFLGAGNLHAYLRGAGVEIMANSDNVIRGGLTTKHVDPDELAAVVDTTPGPAPIQQAAGSRHRFVTPVPEFALVRLEGDQPHHCSPDGPEIVLVTAGRVRVVPDRGGDPVTLGPGDAALAPWSGGPYQIEPEGPSTVWRASAG